MVDRDVEEALDGRGVQGIDGLCALVTEFAARAGLATRLSALRVEADKLPQLAADAAKQWTGTFNPRKVGEAELLALYQAAL